MSHIDISVIIPVYNAGLLIRRCLNSVFSQVGNFTYEVILVDDECTDDSMEIVRSYNSPAVKILKQVNSGPAEARNKGIKEARGKYITFIDADDYWLPSFFEKTISYLEQHSDVTTINVGQKHLTISGEFILPTCINNIPSTIVLNDFFSFWANNMHVCTGSVVTRTEIAKDTNGQRAELIITEDLEFWAYLSLWGKWAFMPEILFVSDGNDVTKKEGWTNKMEKRWYNAPSIAEWEKRIITRMPYITESYKKARGRISRNLTYCQLLSGRLSLSRHEALQYGSFFDKDVIGRLMNIAKYTPFSWCIFAKYLRYREYHRK